MKRSTLGQRAWVISLVLHIGAAALVLGVMHIFQPASQEEFLPQVEVSLFQEIAPQKQTPKIKHLSLPSRSRVATSSARRSGARSANSGSPKNRSRFVDNDHSRRFASKRQQSETRRITHQIEAIAAPRLATSKVPKRSASPRNNSQINHKNSVVAKTVAAEKPSLPEVAQRATTSAPSQPATQVTAARPSVSSPTANAPASTRITSTRDVPIPRRDSFSSDLTPRTSPALRGDSQLGKFSSGESRASSARNDSGGSNSSAGSTMGSSDSLNSKSGGSQNSSGEASSGEGSSGSTISSGSKSSLGGGSTISGGDGNKENGGNSKGERDGNAGEKHVSSKEASTRITQQLPSERPSRKEETLRRSVKNEDKGESSGKSNSRRRGSRFNTGEVEVDPEAIRAARRAAIVIVTYNADGKVTSASISQSSGDPDYDSTCLANARHQKCEPRLDEEGKPQGGKRPLRYPPPR